MTVERDNLIKRLQYQSYHRGCKETDLYLGEFAKKYLGSFSDEELADFEAILLEEDWEIYAWLTGSKELPEKYNTKVGKLLVAFDLPNEVIFKAQK